MAQFGVFLLSLALSLLSAPAKTIERSFLQNDPRILTRLLPTDAHIVVSLPEPISFSDQISAQQASFLFEQVFSAYTTFEFYPEGEFPFFITEEGAILKARWSFRNNRTSDQHVLELFFYLAREDREHQADESPGPQNRAIKWTIAEIKAAEIKAGRP